MFSSSLGNKALISAMLSALPPILMGLIVVVTLRGQYEQSYSLHHQSELITQIADKSLLAAWEAQASLQDAVQVKSAKDLDAFADSAARYRKSIVDLGILLTALAFTPNSEEFIAHNAGLTYMQWQRREWDKKFPLGHVPPNIATAALELNRLHSSVASEGHEILRLHHKVLQANLEEVPVGNSTASRRIIEHLNVARNFNSSISRSFSSLMALVDTNSMEATARIRRHQASTIDLFLACLLLTAILVLLVNLTYWRRSLLIPFRELLAVINQISVGRRDFDTNIRGPKEVRQVARALKEMTRSLDDTTVSKNYFDNIIHSIADSLIVIDRKGRISMVNPATENLLGYHIDTLIGESLELILQNETLLALILNGESFVGGDEEYIAADGEPVSVLLSMSPILDTNSRRVGTVLVAQDTTILKVAQTELEKSRDEAMRLVEAKANFLANMSHEIRTPMNGIIGMTDLALETELDDEQRDLLSTVRSCSDNLLHVVNDILDFSKLESGKCIIESYPFDLRKSIEEITKLIAPDAEQKKLDLQVLIGPGVQNFLIGDMNRIRQVLTNLLSNAIKFSSEGGRVCLQVFEANCDYHTARILFSVTDTGVGIPQDKQSLIFDSFSQADTSTTRQFGGTGLGLAISRELVELMGGELSVKSQEGVGSRFTFSITLGIDAMKAKITHAQANDSVEHLTDGTILLVEDNVVNQRIARHVLETAGYEVVVAASGSEAVDEVKAGDFDLILMDIELPEMNGYEATALIRAIPKATTVPIVALSAHNGAEEKARCVKAGMNSFMAKPLNKSLLLQEIADLVQGQKKEAGDA